MPHASTDPGPTSRLTPSLRPDPSRPAGSSTSLTRTAGTVLAAAVLTGGGMLAAPLAQAADDSVLTATAPASVGAGTAVTVKGRLTSAGAADVGATVRIQSRVVGGRGWRAVSTVTTSATGRWSARFAPTVNTFLRARAVDDDGGVVRSVDVRVDAVQSLRLDQVTPTRPAVGQVATVRGSASVGLRDTTVTLQRRVDGRWTAAATGKVDRTGAFAATTRVADAGPQTYRLRSGSRKSITRVVSAARTVRPTVTATLPAGRRLTTYRQLTSVNGAYRAVVQPSGSLQVLAADGSVRWSSQTSGRRASLRLQADGDLVLSRAGETLWRSRSVGDGANLVLQNDGSLVVFRRGKALWSSTKGLNDAKGKGVRPAECWSTSFDCITYTGYVPSVRYWAMYAGHNCTNYVAYRMGLKGLTTPPWGLPGGSAWEWRAHARRHGFTVDRTPAVGAVMQWNRNTLGGGGSGHVVYVEKVTATGVLISEDSWSGHAAVRTIRRDSAVFASARFLHLADR